MNKSINAAFEGTFKLSHNVKLYIPSTIEVDKSLDTSKWVEKVQAEFSQWFGGATTTEAMGSWFSGTHGLVTEKVVIVESYATTEAVEKHIAEVRKLAETIKRELKQEAVSLEYDHELRLV